MNRNPNWSKEDDDRLIAIYESGNICEQLDNFPGERVDHVCVEHIA